jgi:hypothetical protein
MAPPARCRGWFEMWCCRTNGFEAYHPSAVGDKPTAHQRVDAPHEPRKVARATDKKEPAVPHERYAAGLP